MPCHRYKDEVDSLREIIKESFLLVALERGCARPTPDMGIGVPYLKNVYDVVPFLVDARWDNRLLEKWDSIIILHDNRMGK